MHALRHRQIDRTRLTLGRRHGVPWGHAVFHFDRPSELSSAVTSGLGPACCAWRRGSGALDQANVCLWAEQSDPERSEKQMFNIRRDAVAQAPGPPR
jgi:hypothetical protein